jgi:hypothetical protein
VRRAMMLCVTQALVVAYAPRAQREPALDASELPPPVAAASSSSSLSLMASYRPRRVTAPVVKAPTSASAVGKPTVPREPHDDLKPLDSAAVLRMMRDTKVVLASGCARSTCDRAQTAVERGVWPLYRWQPAVRGEAKSNFQLDSVQLKLEIDAFLKCDAQLTLLAAHVGELCRMFACVTSRDVCRRRRYAARRRRARW